MKTNYEIHPDDRRNKIRSSLFTKLLEWKESLKELWLEFYKVKYGLVGLALLLVFILMILLEPYIIPFPDAGKHWSDITYWENNPRNAAPAWTNLYNSKKGAPHEYIRNPEWEVNKTQQFTRISGTFSYDYQYDIPPSEFTFKALAEGNITLQIELERPDGEVIDLIKKSIRSNKESEVHIPLGPSAQSNAYKFARRYSSEEERSNVDSSLAKPFNILFAEAQKGILTDPEPLKGIYKININAVALGNNADIKDPYLIAHGKVFGFLGTDGSKRDLWSGVVAGTRWAILIGLLTAFVSVVIGVIYGVTAAYYGGWVDSALMRVFEVFYNIPLLPILIVMSALYKPSIWNLIFMMCIFFWVGPVRTVRSIGLQIKEETYIEAAHALDASNSRIIFKHMIPQLIPYAFASMALRVPTAIVYEASISLLGLGDASIVTWGQILHGAMSNGAVLQGLWWWVIPPGLTIALMGMTFAFIGFSMDKILNPKLKTR